MSAKSLDRKKRWRCVNIGLRASPEEAYQIDMMVKTSGLTKQEYIIRQLMEKTVTVYPNSRVQKYLRQYLTELTEELKRLERIGQDSDVLENITYLLELVAKMTSSN